MNEFGKLGRGEVEWSNIPKFKRKKTQKNFISLGGLTQPPF